MIRTTTLRIAGSAIAVTVLAAPALADEEEDHFDAWITVENDRIQVGGVDVDADGATFFPGQRVFEADFGEVIPDFADEPGFYSETLPAGFTLGFDITNAVLTWDGSAFTNVADETITLWQAFGVPDSPSATSPDTIGGTTTGFLFGEADGTGAMDDHPDFVYDAPAGDGIVLLELELWTDQPGIERSEPIWIVFAKNADEAEHEAAAEWVQANLVPAPGLTALLPVAGLAALRRRRA